MNEKFIGFPVGTVVCLKAGGTRMTIVRNDTWNRRVDVAYCEAERVIYHSFEEGALRPSPQFQITRHSRDSDNKTWYAVSEFYDRTAFIGAQTYDSFEAAALACTKRNVESN